MNDRDYAVWALARLGFTTMETASMVRALPAIQRAHEAECSLPEAVAAPFTKAGDRAFALMDRDCAASIGRNRSVFLRRQRDPRGCTVEVYAASSDIDDEPLYRLSGNGFTVDQMDRLTRHADRQAV